MLKALENELKKNLFLPFFVLGVIGVLLLGMCGFVCYDSSGREIYFFSIMLMKNKEEFIKENMITIYSLVNSFTGIWFMTFLPALLVIPFVISMIEEKEKGNLTFLMIRENDSVYCLSKLLSLMIYGGLVCGSAFSIFLVFVLPLKKYCYITPEIEKMFLAYKNAEQLYAYVIIDLFLIVLLGMFSVLPGYFAGIFFKDKHMLICIPVLIRYAISQTFTLLLVNKSIAKDYAKYEKIKKYDIENLLYYPGSVKWLFTLAFMSVLCFAVFVLFVIVVKKRKFRGVYG